MVLDPIPQSLPVHFFGSRPQPPTSHEKLNFWKNRIGSLLRRPPMKDNYIHTKRPTKERKRPSDPNLSGVEFISHVGLFYRSPIHWYRRRSLRWKTPIYIQRDLQKRVIYMKRDLYTWKAIYMWIKKWKMSSSAFERIGSEVCSGGAVSYTRDLYMKRDLQKRLIYMKRDLHTWEAI